MKMPRYDKIGRGYNAYRNADARITVALKELLGLPPGALILDLGAGTGNYTNALAAMGYLLKALEPSAVMRSQVVPCRHVEWLAGSAEAIPLSDASVDGLFATLALHHFKDLPAAADQIWRVCKGPMVFFTIDPRRGEPFWFKEYFPGVYSRLFDQFPATEELVTILAHKHKARIGVQSFPLPHDLSDIHMHAGWNKPEIYLDPTAHSGMSGLVMADPLEVRAGLDRLKDDLVSGKWDQLFGHLRERNSCDLGFIFIKIEPA